MADQTTIEWCDATFNPWIGCTRVSPGCDNCYAAAQDNFRNWTPEGWGGPRKRTSEANWRQPLAWDRKAKAEAKRLRVFCASLADVFDNEVPPEWRADLFDLIERTPNLDWLLLTKRIGNVMKMIPEASATGRLPKHVLLGATVVNQEERDRDLAKLLAVPAYRHFLSMEPLLGPVDLKLPCGHDGKALIDWVIVGGESGPGARPLQLQWARDIVRQCRAVGAAVLVKQLGRQVLDDGMSSPGEHWPSGTDRRSGVPRPSELDPGFMVHLADRKGGDWAEWPEDLRVRQFPGVQP